MECMSVQGNSMLKQSLIVALLLLGMVTTALCFADGYELGQGWHGGNYYLSGYTSLEIVDRFDAPSKLDLDDLSLFAGGRINQWVNPFMETELSKHTLIRQGGNPQHGDVIIERFYNDLIFSEQDSLRVGKMLTPLGDWNLVHASPLVPLVTRPYSTGAGFHDYVSGVNWKHDLGEGLPHVEVYWQPDNEWFKRPSSQTVRNFHNVSGVHVNFPMGLIDKIGLSVQHGQLISTAETYSLFGYNFSKTLGDIRLQSEGLSAAFSGTVASGGTRFHKRESGLFALADYAFSQQWHGILEAEYYRDHLMPQSSRSVSVATYYKPSVPTMLKLEYIHQAGVETSFAPIKTGVKASFSFMF